MASIPALRRLHRERRNLNLRSTTINKSKRFDRLLRMVMRELLEAGDVQAFRDSEGTLRFRPMGSNAGGPAVTKGAGDVA